MLSEQMQETFIFIDYRENKSGIPEKLDSLGTKIKQSTLTVGDYLINNHILIERKSATDFIKSLVSNRLWDQYSRLRNSRFRTLIIIEGDEFKTTYQVDYNGVQGALIAVAISWQLPILFSKGHEHTCKILTMIQSREMKEEIFRLYPIRKSKNWQSQNSISVRITRCRKIDG